MTEMKIALSIEEAADSQPAIPAPLLFKIGHCHLQEGRQSTIQRHSFICMNKLSDVRGRITYISSYAKQENLYAFYETTDHYYWTDLAKCNQQEFQKSGTEGKCIEAREFIIALPESFPNFYEPDKLLQLFTDRFKEKYGVECISALHHNKRKTNYHIHLIFSERELLPEPIEKIATRNMFYDEQGKHFYTGLINLLVKDDKEKRMRWNREVDKAIISGVTETEIQQIKQEYIADRIS